MSTLRAIIYKGRINQDGKSVVYIRYLNKAFEGFGKAVKEAFPNGIIPQ